MSLLQINDLLPIVIVKLWLAMIVPRPPIFLAKGERPVRSGQLLRFVCSPQKKNGGHAGRRLRVDYRRSWSGEAGKKPQDQYEDNGADRRGDDRADEARPERKAGSAK